MISAIRFRGVLEQLLVVICWAVSVSSGPEGLDLLIGARVVAFNSHFQYFFSPHVPDSELGSVQSWLAGSALPLLDSFEPLKSSNPGASNKSLWQCGVVWV